MGAGGQLWQGIAGGTGSIRAEIEGEIAIKVIGHLHTSVNDKLQVVPDATAGSIDTVAIGHFGHEERGCVDIATVDKRG